MIQNTNHAKLAGGKQEGWFSKGVRVFHSQNDMIVAGEIMILKKKKEQSRLSVNGFYLRGWQCETSVDTITRAWSHLQ